MTYFQLPANGESTQLSIMIIIIIPLEKSKAAILGNVQKLLNLVSMYHFFPAEFRVILQVYTTNIKM